MEVIRRETGSKTCQANNGKSQRLPGDAVNTWLPGYCFATWWDWLFLCLGANSTCQGPKCFTWELLIWRDDGPPQTRQKLALLKSFIHCVQFGQTHNKYNFPTSLIFISYAFFRHIRICEQSGRFQTRQELRNFLQRKPPETKTQSARLVYSYGEEINSQYEAAWQADGTYL